MRPFVGCVLIIGLLLTSSLAQSGDWAAVEGLTADSDIFVKTKQGNKYQGEFDSADPSRLVLWSRERSLPGRVIVKREIARGEVRQVRSNHRLASVAAGAAIGAGIGVGLGAAIDARAKSNEDNGLAGFVFGILGAGLGAILGRTHPFLKGKPIYQAP